MSAGKFDLPIEQGATLRHTFQLNDQNGALVDLTGYTAQMQIRQTVQSQVPLTTLTTENGGIVMGGANGQIELIISATQTSKLLTQYAVYDLKIIAPNGDVTRLLEGMVTVSAAVTR